jgi:hypothetical protein
MLIEGEMGVVEQDQVKKLLSNKLAIWECLRVSGWCDHPKKVKA